MGSRNRSFRIEDDPMGDNFRQSLEDIRVGFRDSAPKVRNIPEAAHLRNRQRKSLKNDFPSEIPVEWWPFWYHSDGLAKLYKLSYVNFWKFPIYPEFKLIIPVNPTF